MEKIEDDRILERIKELTDKVDSGKKALSGDLWRDYLRRFEDCDAIVFLVENYFVQQKKRRESREEIWHTSNKVLIWFLVIALPWAIANSFDMISSSVAKEVSVIVGPIIVAIPVWFSVRYFHNYFQLGNLSKRIHEECAAWIRNGASESIFWELREIVNETKEGEHPRYSQPSQFRWWWLRVELDLIDRVRRNEREDERLRLGMLHNR